MISLAMSFTYLMSMLEKTSEIQASLCQVAILDYHQADAFIFTSMSSLLPLLASPC